MQSSQSTCRSLTTAAHGIPAAAEQQPAPLVDGARDRAAIAAAWTGGAAARSEVAAWAQHAGAANGFGDATLRREDAAEPLRATPPSPATRGDAARVAQDPPRTHRTHAIAPNVRALDRALFRSLVRSLAAALQRARERWQRNRRARDIYVALHALDAHTLRDLGLHHSEILSLATEITGGADVTRVHTLQALGDSTPGVSSARPAFPSSSQGEHHHAS